MGPVRTALALLAVALFPAACTSSSPSAPSDGPSPPATPSPAPGTFQLSGTITSTNGGQPISASLDFGGVAGAADHSGRYNVSLPAGASAPLSLSISGAGLVTRRTFVGAGFTRTLDLDVISDRGEFDLGFYRQLVRDGFESPGELRPLRRWMSRPNILLKTVDEGGTPIDSRTLDSTEATLREAMTVWTGGAYSASITRGTEGRRGQSGWVTVIWLATAPGGFCGRAEVGGGLIELAYQNGSCRCAGGPEIRQRTVKHELGHTMGFWHTDAPNDVMFPVGGFTCDQTISARERHHAAIAYKRPSGNLDPDSDPSSSVNLAPIRIE